MSGLVRGGDMQVGVKGQLTDPDPGVVASLSEPGLTADLNEEVVESGRPVSMSTGVRRETIVRSEDSILFGDLLWLRLMLRL